MKVPEPDNAGVHTDVRDARTPEGGCAAPHIQALTAHARLALLAHFLALNDEDRRLRFNQPTRDRTIGHYVDSIDFDRDAVFGVCASPLSLDGVGHLVRLHDDADPHAAEFGVSVSEGVRGHGIGTALLQRAVAHACGMRVKTLRLRFLSHNAAMMRIARNAGMTIQCAFGEADAWLAVPPPDNPATIALESHCTGPGGDPHGIPFQSRTTMAAGLC
ncbi:GNAT family N-acetyltransferase [Paraburkholderia sp. GAS334]|uniref:GNAT family N-acetyltransferase n=1 Tax=Paraburkholderia sp. GAS334 TaxID=3035131 RepID=UPI003D208A12